nr:cell division/cell wall cluster transcriptional repressor MraZ [Bacilli bacterium]
RQFSRFFFSGAAELDLDKQGRVLVPQNLRDYAGITMECVIIGVGTRIEIWDELKWFTYADEASDGFDELAERLVDLDL